MKVGFFDKKLWRDYCNIISVICGIVSFIVIFIDIPTDKKLTIGITFFVVLCIIFGFMFIRANRIKEKVLQINGTKFVVKFGDLFSERGLKTITFNEYFDTIVDERLISSNTINGKFLNDKVANIAQLDKEIENNIECKKNIISFNKTRIHGKKAKYKLGTALRFSDYIIVAFSKFDEHDCAYLSLADYLSCLANYWSEVNRIYNGENVVLPLLGTGITRLMCGNSISCQRALEIIIQTFEYSNLSFAQDFQITLVLPEKLKSSINLYNLGGK